MIMEVPHPRRGRQELPKIACSFNDDSFEFWKGLLGRKKMGENKMNENGKLLLNQNEKNETMEQENSNWKFERNKTSVSLVPKITKCLNIFTTKEDESLAFSM